MPLDKLIAVGLPIAIGVVMIDRGGRGQLHRSQIDPRFLPRVGGCPLSKPTVRGQLSGTPG